MANSTLSLSFKIADGADGFKQLTVDAEGLRKVMNANVTEADKLNKDIANLASTAKAIDAVAGAFQQLNSYLTDLTDAMAAQQVVETQLAVTMRNSMAATDSQVQAIKELCSAQQQIGVVGDEVQLAGAQKMATFLKEEESIRNLIPAMNDMLVAQNGLKSTQENAVTVATLFAKAMAGQTTGFKRLGWELSDVQEQILKFGTEQQKVAVITDLVKSKVGGMNEELAKTESGMIQQSKNLSGDWKEQWGSMAAAITPTVTLLASATVAIGGFTKVALGIKTAYMALTKFSLGSKALVLLLKALGFEAVRGANMFNTFTKSAQIATNTTRIMTAAFRSFLIAGGVYIAIELLTRIIDSFTSSSEKAVDATTELIDASKAAEREAERINRSREETASKLEQERAALEINISTLKNFNGTKTEEKKLVSEMNSKYGETMGYFSSISEWYNTLIANSEDYCRQMEIEAETRAIANRIAQRKEEQRQITHDEYGNTRRYSTVRRVQQKETFFGTPVDELDTWGSIKRQLIPWGYGHDFYLTDSERDKAQAAYDDLEAKNAADRKRMQQLAEKKSRINYKVKGSEENPEETPTVTPSRTTQTDNTPVFRENARSPREMKENVRYFQAQFDGAKDFAAQAEANKNIDIWQKKLEAANNAGKAAEAPEELKLIDDPETIEAFNNNLEYYNKELLKAPSKEAAAEINVQIKALQDLKRSYEEAGLAAEDNNPKLVPDATKLSDIEGNISYWQKQLDDASEAEAATINRNIELWQKKADAIRNAGKEAKSALDSYRSGWNSFKGIGSGLESVTKALEGNGTTLQMVTGLVDGLLQVYDGVKGIVDLVDALTGATRASAAAKAVENAVTAEGTVATTADTAASVENTAAKAGEGIANATASGAKLPFPANIAAIAAGVAAVVAAFAMVGTFATGGIVGGSSFTGDRMIARVNSGEMILNKSQQSNLFRMLNSPLSAPGLAPGVQRVDFNPEPLFASRRPEMKFPRVLGRLSGRDIVLAVANETRIASKSGRSSNIKI